MKRLLFGVRLAIGLAIPTSNIASADGQTVTLSCTDGWPYTYLASPLQITSLQNASSNGSGCDVSPSTNALSSPQQFAVGGGDDVFSQFGFAAHSDPLGVDPSGYFRTNNLEAGISAQGHVTCLSVYGNRATIGFEVEKSSDPTRVGQGALIWVVDNGSANLGADGIQSPGFTPTPPTTCPPFFGPYSPVVKGNIVVKQLSS